MMCFFANDFCVGMSSLSSNDSARAHVLMKDSTKWDRAVIRLMQRVDQGGCRALGLLVGLAGIFTVHSTVPMALIMILIPVLINPIHSSPRAYSLQKGLPVTLACSMEGTDHRSELPVNVC